MRLQDDVKGCNTLSHEKSTNTRGITFTIIEDEIDSLGLNGSEEKTYRQLKRLIRLCGGGCDWPERRILAHLGMRQTTYRRHRRKLEASGWILVQRRRQFGCRLNDTNILRLGNGGAKNAPQKRTEKDLKTKTHTRENPRKVVSADPEVKARPREAWEARREKDRRDHEAAKARYEAVGRAIVADREARIAAREQNRRWWREGHRSQWDRGRHHRLERALERTRGAENTRNIIEISKNAVNELHMRNLEAWGWKEDEVTK